MKNPVLPAVVLLVLGGAVFGVAWWLDGADADETAAPLDRPEYVEDAIVPSTPQEIRRAEKLKKAQDELAHYQEIGELTDWGAIKVPDVDGGHYFVKPKLVKGVGRFGEPIYGIARYKRRPTVPLVKRRGQEYENFKRATPAQEKALWDKWRQPPETAEGANGLPGTLPAGALEGATGKGKQGGKGGDGPKSGAASDG